MPLSYMNTKQPSIKQRNIEIQPFVFNYHILNIKYFFIME